MYFMLPSVMRHPVSPSLASSHSPSLFSLPSLAFFSLRNWIKSPFFLFSSFEGFVFFFASFLPPYVLILRSMIQRYDKFHEYNHITVKICHVEHSRDISHKAWLLTKRSLHFGRNDRMIKTLHLDTPTFIFCFFLQPRPV